MSAVPGIGEARAGWRWGPFTFRLPFYHTRLYWPEFLQGVAVAAATGLALVPILTTQFGLTFEQAVAMSLVHGILVCSAPILFGEPYCPGWITPALPLALTFVLTGYDTHTERFQAMTALALTLTGMLMIFGLSGIGRRLMEWLPSALKAAIVMGAAIASFKRVLIDDADRYLLVQPVATVVACAVCLLLMFSIPFARMKQRWSVLAGLASLGLLPGFLAAAIIGPLFGEVSYEVEWGFLLPPVHEVWAVASPFSIGWPGWEMYVAAVPLAFVTYIILFGDLVAANEITREAASQRQDDVVHIDPTRTHLSLAARNAAMAVAAPFFPTQGSVWTGVHVVVTQRWRQGRQQMDSLFSGIHSYYFMGIPFIYFLMPLLTGLKPLMGIALSLTLVLTGFACAYVAMAMARHPVERGVALLGGMALAVLDPWIGLLAALGCALLLVGAGREAGLEQTDGSQAAP